ncbi:MAG: efflux transporter periplasmic adaptor subunit, partial [Thiobacillus sp.]|nr:efflux transporter periplasmic adaptor subunit [Thiobacillus sp.]
GQGPGRWVIRQGLKAGDRVIVDGMARIFFPGMPVAATEAGAVPAKPAAPPAQAAAK